MAIRKQVHRQRDPYPSPPASGAYAKIAYSFVALTVVVVLAALWFSSVSATVTVSATREEMPIALELDVSKNPTESQIAGRVIQGVFDGMDEYTVTSSQATMVPGTSVGRVRITNTYSSNQPLVKTTRLLTSDGRLYRISDSVTVPAGGSVEVEAYADQMGSNYDFSTPTSFSIPGLSVDLQRFVTAKSITSFTGGQQSMHVLTQSDIANAQRELRDKIVLDAEKKLRASVTDSRFAESAYVPEDVEVNTSARAGDQTDHFMLSLRVKVTGVFYAKSDMDTFVKNGIASHVPVGHILAADDPVKVTYDVSSANPTLETAHITVNADVLTKPTNADGFIAKDAIAGLPVNEAVQTLEQMKGVENADVVVHPSWVRRLPKVTGKITVKIR